MSPDSSSDAGRTPGVRLAELMGALSLATDLGMGQPMEFALQSCVLSMRLGEKIGLNDDDLRRVYYQALLRYIGCNADTDVLASIFGDELALRTDYAAVDAGNTVEVLTFALRHIRRANANAPPLQLAHALAQGVLTVPNTVKQSFAGHCEVAQRLAARMGFDEHIRIALGQLYERWDGRGTPNGLKGEQIALAVRIVTLAQDAITFHRMGGLEAAVAVARQRSAAAYDPQVAEVFGRYASELLVGLDESSWDTVLALEPGQRIYLSSPQFNTACQAIADFADLKSPYTRGHSHRVAALAADVALRCGLPETDVNTVRRAGWLHELGRVGVSTGIWTKTGRLSDREWEQVRLHPYYTERVLARPKALARLGLLAAFHHERLDGSGYHRGAGAAMMSPAARILAAANAYQAMTEDRPHRPARSPDAAADELRRETRAGRFDSEIVQHVLGAAGHAVRPRQKTLVAGLSEREIEVLRLVARGQSMGQIANQLHISRKTVDNHIQHIYAKTGVSTRAGATLFAIEQDLLPDSD